MINAIVAVDNNQGIGYKGSMPWPHLHYDMLWFKLMTENNVIMMGRRTWESMNKRNLPNRKSIIVSKKMDPEMDIWMPDIDSAITYYKIYLHSKDLYIIGGGEIYNACKSFVQKWYVTEVNKNYDCDTFFDYNFVKQTIKNRIEIAKFESPVEHTIYEYNNETSRI